MAKGQQPKRGIGGTLANARSIASSEKTQKKNIGKGLPSTYFGNSKACNTEKGTK